MTRASKTRKIRLSQLETAFEPLLLSCLQQAANGRWGLFGQNDHLDPEHRYWNWPEARLVVEMAEEIRALCSEAGELNSLAERLLHCRSLRGPSVPGEPNLAREFLRGLTVDSLPGEAQMDESWHGRPLAIASEAKSASPTEPPFIARPDNAPVYHGFVILDDVTVDGFTLGMITDWEAEPCEEGDAFVIAPDGTRAGLVWETCDESHFREVLPLEAARWGVWDVGFCLPMNSRDNARRNLESILPELQLRWANWKSRFNP
jgi:hypothetical protein